MRKEIAKFTVNGRTYEVPIESHETLIEVIRDKLDLTGTKYSCGAGECGSCTVLIEGKPVLSCLTLAATAKDKNILTIEGLAEKNTLHPIQKAFIENGAVQCGYCTPGMVLSAKSLLDENPFPTKEKVEVALAGNLCRCTGYIKIIRAVLTASETIKKEGPIAQSDGYSVRQCK